MLYEVITYLGLGGKTADQKVEKLIAAIEELKRKVDIPASIREAGVDEAAFMQEADELAVQAFDDQCTGANPRFPLVKELAEIYRKAYAGS